jgi:hypothetical protein
LRAGGEHPTWGIVRVNIRKLEVLVMQEYVQTNSLLDFCYTSYHILSSTAHMCTYYLILALNAESSLGERVVIQVPFNISVSKAY